MPGALHREYFVPTTHGHMLRYTNTSCDTRTHVLCSCPSLVYASMRFATIHEDVHTTIDPSSSIRQKPCTSTIFSKKFPTRPMVRTVAPYTHKPARPRAKYTLANKRYNSSPSVTESCCMGTSNATDHTTPDLPGEKPTRQIRNSTGVTARSCPPSTCMTPSRRGRKSALEATNVLYKLVWATNNDTGSRLRRPIQCVARALAQASTSVLIYVTQHRRHAVMAKGCRLLGRGGNDDVPGVALGAGGQHSLNSTQAVVVGHSDQWYTTHTESGSQAVEVPYFNNNARPARPSSRRQRVCLSNSGGPANHDRACAPRRASTFSLPSPHEHSSQRTLRDYHYQPYLACVCALVSLEAPLRSIRSRSMLAACTASWLIWCLRFCIDVGSRVF